MNWEISIQDIPGVHSCNVFIYCRKEYGTVCYLEIKSPEIIVHTTKVDPGADNQIKPTFTCNRYDALEIAKGFIAYANEQGFKNGSETFNKGKLEATEKHLEDMRKIVFEDVRNPLIFSTNIDQTIQKR